MFEDIRPKKKSLREVLNTKSDSRRDLSPPAPSLPVEGESFRLESRKKIKILLVSVLVLAVVGGGVSALSLFGSRAVVKITPAQAKLFLRENLVASRSPGEAGLSFEMMILNPRAVSREIPSTGREQVERRASGTIVIFNDYGGAPQRLVADTRFEAPGGKIFRIDKTVIVPGREVVGGKNVPGSVEAVVYADEPGEEYNLGLVDFTIPGLRGGPRFEKFFARSKTPLTDGLVGEVNIVDPELVASTRLELREELSRELKADAFLQLPSRLVLYGASGFVRFEESSPVEPTAAGGKNAALVKESASWRGIVFDRQELTRVLVGDKLKELADVDWFISNLDRLDFQWRLPLRDPETDEKISFVITGNAFISAVMDVDSLRLALAGVKREEVNKILRGFPTVGTTTVDLRPSWRRWLPTDHRRITVEVVINDE